MPIYTDFDQRLCRQQQLQQLWRLDDYDDYDDDYNGYDDSDDYNDYEDYDNSMTMTTMMTTMTLTTTTNTMTTMTTMTTTSTKTTTTLTMTEFAKFVTNKFITKFYDRRICHQHHDPIWLLIARLRDVGALRPNLSANTNNILPRAEAIFSVTRRSRSDSRYLLTYWLTDLLTHLLIISTDLTDVTLVSDDTHWRLDWCYSSNGGYWWS